MEWINYHHLLYFWVAAREGSISAASRKLRLAQPTVSAQIRTLESALGHRLFDRSGRKLELTDSGRLAYRYADEIFGLGRELLDTMRGRAMSGPLRLHVGIADVLPKLVAYRLLNVAIEALEDVHVICSEGKPPELLARLAVHEIDLVLSDRPISPEVSVKAYNHLLGESGITIFGDKRRSRRLQRRFPLSLEGEDFLVPTDNTALRQALDGWFETLGVQPRFVAEIEDSALIKVFGESGAGLFAAPTVVEGDVLQKYKVGVVGRTDEVRERFYAISAERKIRHPAVVAIANFARQGFLSSGRSSD